MTKYLNIAVIHPIDSSTDFLIEVHNFLGCINNIKMRLIRPNPKFSTDDIDLINSSDLILFLGHGHSSRLYGGIIEGEKSILIDIEKAQSIFKEKKIILFACNSDQFLKKIHNETNLVVANCIGFGDMPTSWDEIMSQRDIGDANYLKDLTENALLKYKKALVTTLINSLKYIFENNLGFRYLYLSIKLMINKEVNSIIRSKDFTKEEKRILIYLMIEHKNQISWK